MRRKVPRTRFGLSAVTSSNTLQAATQTVPVVPRLLRPPPSPGAGARSSGRLPTGEEDGESPPQRGQPGPVARQAGLVPGGHLLRVGLGRGPMPEAVAQALLERPPVGRAVAADDPVEFLELRDVRIAERLVPDANGVGLAPLLLLLDRPP